MSLISKIPAVNDFLYKIEVCHRYKIFTILQYLIHNVVARRWLFLNGCIPSFKALAIETLEGI